MYNVELIYQRLADAVTSHDRKQSRRKGYNPNALGLYLQAVTETIRQIEAGRAPAPAIRANFNDRLLDECLRAVPPDLCRPITEPRGLGDQKMDNK